MGILKFIKSLAPIFLYAAGFFVFLASMTGRVNIGLSFLIPLLPLQNILDKLQQYPSGKDFNDILMIGMIIGWIVSRHSRGQKLFDKTPYNKVLFLYFIFTYIMLWKGSFYLGAPLPLDIHNVRLDNWKNYMVLPLIFFLTFNNLKDSKEIKRLFIFMCVSMLLVNYYTVPQVSDVSAWYNRTKIQGTFVWLGVNEVASFYAMNVFVLIGVLFFERDKRLKLGLLGLIIVAFYCILFTFSRGEYLAVVAGLFFIAATRKRWLFIPLILLLIFWQVVLPQNVIERIQFSDMGAGQLDASAENRLVAWQMAMSFFAKSPIFGVGFNVIRDLVNMDTHNIYVKFLAEEGLIGFGFFLTIMFTAIRHSWRLYRRANDTFLKGLGFGFCGCVIVTMVGNFFGERWIHIPLIAFFWTFLGMVERGNAIVDEEEKNKCEKGTSREDVRTLGREDVKDGVDEIKEQKPRVKVWKVRRGEKSS